MTNTETGSSKLSGRPCENYSVPTKDEALKLLGQHGSDSSLAEEALKVAKTQGAPTDYSVVDAPTRLSQRTEFAGDRTQADMRASQLLALAIQNEASAMGDASDMSDLHRFLRCPEGQARLMSIHR